MNRSCNLASYGGMVVALVIGGFAQPDWAACAEPVSRKPFDKPDFATVARPDPGKFKCLVVFASTPTSSSSTTRLRVEAQRPKFAEFTWVNCPPNAVEAFPGSYDKLFAYNTIVLSDVNYKAIGNVGFEMLCDYVEQGGSLLVTGGPYALGNGEFEGSRFLQILPVTLSGPFDLKWAGKGKSWTLRPSADDVALLAGVSFRKSQKSFGIILWLRKKAPRWCSKRATSLRWSSAAMARAKSPC